MILIYGCLAGVIATIPMTVFMYSLFRLLPGYEQYPLPPRKITMNVAEKINLKEKLNENQRRYLTFLCHFAYGGAMGILYVFTTKFLTGATFLSGLIFGLLVWITSYIFALPWLDLFPRADLQPLRRNLLMISAHLVWGTALVAILKFLSV